MADSKKNIKTDWIKTKPAELEKLILELHKNGNSLAKLGLILRDKHGVPKAKLIGKRIGRVLSSAGEKVETQLDTLNKEKTTLEKHISKNKHDYNALRSLHKKLWDINKAEKQLKA